MLEVKEECNDDDPSKGQSILKMVDWSISRVDIEFVGVGRDGLGPGDNGIHTAKDRWTSDDL